MKIVVDGSELEINPESGILILSDEGYAAKGDVTLSSAMDMFTSMIMDIHDERTKDSILSAVCTAADYYNMIVLLILSVVDSNKEEFKDKILDLVKYMDEMMQASKNVFNMFDVSALTYNEYIDQVSDKIMDEIEAYEKKDE